MKEDPKENPESPKLRNWSMKVIDEYSGVPLPDDAKRELQSYPITRRGENIISCGRIPASVVYRGPYSVTVSEDRESCIFSIDGATRISAKCPSIPASVAARFGVIAIESNGRCVFELGG